MKIFSFFLGANALKHKFQMQNARAHRDDQYLNTKLSLTQKLGGGDFFITAVTPLFDEKVHHMIIKGCTDDVHHTRDATEHVNCDGEQIIFSWAMSAGQLEFPPGAGIHVSGRSGIKSIAIEAHYKDAFHGVDNLTGVELEFTSEPPQKTVGIYLLASASFQPGMKMTQELFLLKIIL